MQELRRELAGRPVKTSLPGGPLLARFDFSLLQHSLANMAHLREKLEATPSQPELLLTEPGVGYRLFSQA